MVMRGEERRGRSYDGNTPPLWEEEVMENKLHEGEEVVGKFVVFYVM